MLLDFPGISPEAEVPFDSGVLKCVSACSDGNWGTNHAQNQVLYPFFLLPANR